MGLAYLMLATSVLLTIVAAWMMRSASRIRAQLDAQLMLEQALTHELRATLALERERGRGLQLQAEELTRELVRQAARQAAAPAAEWTPPPRMELPEVVAEALRKRAEPESSEWLELYGWAIQQLQAKAKAETVAAAILAGDNMPILTEAL